MTNPPSAAFPRGSGRSELEPSCRNGSAGSSARPLISTVVPCYNEGEVLPLLCARLRQLGDLLAEEFDSEFVLVDDGSRDTTWSHVRAAHEADARFRGVRLSRNFGHQAALTCGYALARGDAVVCLDADLQDPPEVIPEMVRRWCQGADVVYGVRRRREGETAFKRSTAKVFYRIVRALGAAHVQPDCGDFRLLSRRSVQALLSLSEEHRFLRGMVGWIGFPTAFVEYDRKSRAAGETKYPVRKMVQFAADAIVSFSRFPLRLAYYSAAALSLVFIAYLTYAVVAVVWNDAELVPGWSSLILAVIAFGATNLLCQALLGEYVGRIYEQCKGRPLYIIQEVMAEYSPCDSSSYDCSDHQGGSATSVGERQTDIAVKNPV